MPDDAQPDLPSDPSATFNPDITDILARRDENRPTTGGALRTLPRWDVATPGRAPDQPSERPRFVLRRRAGFGGYGEVWEATQSSLERIVAVKVIREDVRGEQGVGPLVEAFFRHEAETTAKLEHPNIVPIYDLGADENGRPLLAMKFAHGRAWNELLAADLRDLEPRAYYAKHVTILIAVGQAVAYAHSRGVIHRDLKPAQVIVGEFGEVLLTDWGIAIDLERDRRGGDAVTSGPAGTVAYMAPEQTRGDPSLIGTWTDVYLLGGTLYQLLTATVPHDASDPMAALSQAAEGFIAPPRPMPDRVVPEELLSIAMAALAPDPAARIQTAGELVRRLQGYLAGTSRRDESEGITREVERRLPSLGIDYAAYTALVARLSKASALWPENPRLEPLRDRVLEAFAREAIRNGDLVLAQIEALQIRDEEMRRAILAEAESRRAAIESRERQRRGAFIAAAVLGVVLAASLVVYTRIIAREREQAVTARRQAEDLLNFMLRDLGQNLEPIGKLGLLEGVSQKAMSYFAALPAELATDETRAQQARALDAVGDVLYAEGKLEKSNEAYEKAFAIRKELAGRDPSGLDEAADLATSHMRRARGLRAGGDAAGAREGFREAQSILQSVVERAPSNAEWRHEYASATSRYGEVLLAMGDVAPALAQLKRSLQSFAELAAVSPGDLDKKRDVAVAHSKVGDALDAKGDTAAALEEYESYLRIMQELVSKDPQALEWTRELAVAHNSVGWAHRSLGSSAEALGHFEQQRALMREVTRREPSNSNWQRELAFSEAVIGRMLRANGDARGAVASLTASRDILRDWAERDPSNSTWRRDAAVSQTLLAQALWAAGQRSAAIAEMDDAAGTLEALVGSDPSNSGWARDLAQTRRLLGPMLTGTGDAARGRDELERAVALMEPLTSDLKTSPPPFLDTRASALLLLGRTVEAKPLVDRLTEVGWSDPDYAALLRETNGRK